MNECKKLEKCGHCACYSDLDYDFPGCQWCAVLKENEDRSALLLQVEELQKKLDFLKEQEPIVEAALRWAKCLAEFDGDQAYCGERSQAFFDVLDKYENGKTEKRNYTGNYRCLSCDWVATSESRPLSRGTKVGCPKCGKDAEYR